MTKIFTTNFSIDENVPVVELLNDIKNWVKIGRDKFKKPPFDNLERIISEENCEFISDSDSIKKIISVDDINRHLGISYTTLDLENSKYSTDIIIRTNLESNRKDVSVVLDYKSSQVYCKNKGVKVPIISKQIFNNYAGGFDGNIPIHVGYHRIEEGEEFFISDFLKGRGNNKLPIVYVSVANRTNQAIINPRVLAEELRSIAHVYLEPYSDFSEKMFACMNNPKMSCYGGAIRVYWPGDRKPHENHFWKKDDFKSVSGEFYNQIASRIIANYIVRRSIFQETDYLSFNDLEQIHSKNRLKKLSEERKESEEREKALEEKRKKDLEEHKKKTISQKTQISDQNIKIGELENRVKIFEESESLYEEALNSYELETSDLKDKISEQKDEITKLYDELERVRNYNESLVNGFSQTSSKVSLDADPSSLTSDKIKEVLLYALDKSTEYISPRYSQIVNLILSSEEETLNQFEEKRLNELTIIESIFRNSQDGLCQKDIQIIEKMGYTITKEGKHYKMKTNDDFFEESFTIPCTPEDHRAMKNNFSDLRKKFY